MRHALAALAEAGVVPAIAAPLAGSAGAATERLGAEILEQIPAFSASGNPEVLPELAEHAALQVAEIRRLLSGGRPGDFGFLRQHARRRAEQKFPLEATLHAYRCGHKVLSRWIREAVSSAELPNQRQAVASVADFSIDYIDTISTIATAEYVDETRRLAERETDRRSELLDVLLRGYDESDGRVTRLLRRAGYLEQRQAFCVAVVQPVEPREMENPARAQRLVDAVTSATAALRLRTLTGVRDNQIIAVFSDTRRLSGWTAPQTTLAERVRRPLLAVGPAATIGLSTDAPSTSHVRRALDEARLALEFASVADRVVRYADVPVRKLILRVARDNVQSALPAWIDGFLAADRRARGKLLATLRAYADADLNVLQTAKRLSVHPNTVYARLQKISDETGLDAAGYHALTELLLAADCRAPRKSG